jgi:hypothetical protein
MFAIYRMNKTDCEFVRNVTVAGVLCDRIGDRAKTMKPKKDDTMPWALSGIDLCRAVITEHGIEEDAETCKVVSDATYTRSDALILEINHVWGFSYGPWTPILLRMSVLFEDERPKGKATPVECFPSASQQQDFVHEFLYLQRGHTDGTRSWGRTGMVNAALLYPDALAHLLGKIGFTQES